MHLCNISQLQKNIERHRLVLKQKWKTLISISIFLNVSVNINDVPI